MKYIFEMLFVTLAFLIIAIGYLAVAFWKFDFGPYKELKRSYVERMESIIYQIRRMLW